MALIPSQKFSSITLALTLMAASAAVAKAAEPWAAPIPEELAMKSVPQAPGAPAVYLFREENTDDRQRVYTEYVRIKVLTEGGKDRANVELKYVTGNEHNFAIAEIEGRTIHPDGTIVPLTGKSYDRSIVKFGGTSRRYEYKAKVFTLPDVTVGSVLEYRYKILMPQNSYRAPRWIVQDSLFLIRGHFMWRTSEKPLYTIDERGELLDTASFTPVLPPGVQVKQSTSGGGGALLLDLDVHDIASLPEEEFMPPVSTLGYRVIFYYAPYNKVDDYWKGEGKHWSKVKDKFIGPGAGVGGAVAQLASANDKAEQKLRKIYAAVEQIENTDYTRQRSGAEDKALGLKEVHTTDEIWAQKRGTGNQIAALFVAMARAAGMKAYLVAVTNRDRTAFNRNFLEMDQFDDDIAIVNVDGKEVPFDPGSRDCPYGHLSWVHTETGALRQTDGATELVVTPGEAYFFSGVNRVANLTMDASGVATGTVTLKFMGYTALKWRHEALRSDLDAVQRDLKESVERMLPGSVDVKLMSIGKLDEYEEPLTVSFAVSGPIGSTTGKRLLVPGDIFESNAKATFAGDKRDLAIWFSYRYGARDVVRIALPAGYQIESVPPDGVVKAAKVGGYSLKASSDSNSVTVRRDLFLTDIFFAQDKYADLRAFYNQFETKDQEPVVVKVGATAQAGN